MSSFISKDEQAEVIAKLNRMATESMCPEDFEAITKLLARLADTRSISHSSTLLAVDFVSTL